MFPSFTLKNALLENRPQEPESKTRLFQPPITRKDEFDTESRNINIVN